MQWHDHSKDFPEGMHLFLSPSSAKSWGAKTKEELFDAYVSKCAADIGTAVHEKAADYIRFRQKITNHQKTDLWIHLLKSHIPSNVIDIDYLFDNFKLYVNDSVQFGMRPEVGLRYNENAGGHCDAISFRRDVLRIHDLKTGKREAGFEQLEAYAALFCLEYGHDPSELRGINLRIYQNGEFREEEPSPDLIHNWIIDIQEKEEYVTAFLKEGRYGV